MRDIKFRIWDTKHNTWFPGHFKVYTEETLKLGEQFEIMQFTGIQDKNGVDIYEGDILEVKIESTRFTNSVYKKLEIKMLQSDYNNGWNFSQIDSEYGEVIGNIYENGYLLKEKE